MTTGTCYLGVDLGGTQMRMGAVAPDGRLLTDVLSVPTGLEFGADALRATLRQMIGDLKARLPGQTVAAVGFGIAGVVDQAALSQSPNLPLLDGVDLADLLGEAVPHSVALENDARCFALAEARFGAGRGARHLCGITLGTGVGCGVIVNGRPHRGEHSQAGEVWNVPLRGSHLEHFLAGAGIVRGYEAAGGSLDEGLDAAEIADRARGGDAAAVAAWQSFAEDLAFLCAFAISLIDPERIVIGGSLAQASDLWGPVLTGRLIENKTPIVTSQLGAAAGVIGAAALNMA
jgi:glucokinase